MFKVRNFMGLYVYGPVYGPSHAAVYFMEAAEFVCIDDHHSLHASGGYGRQRPHVAQDDILLLGC